MADPAFPSQVDFDSPRTGVHYLGMTLRDYFAAKAMQAFISTYANGQADQFDHIAGDAYDVADMMLKARAGELD